MDESLKRVCAYCGKEFYIKNKLATKAKFCSEYCSKHEKIKCIVCGKEFEKNKNSRKRACSKECSNILREQTSIDKYGVKNISQLESINNKKIQTSLEHYGTEHPAQSQYIKDKTEQTHIKKYGVKNINQLESTKEKIKQTNLERYGMWKSQLQEVRKNKSNIMKEKWADKDYISKYREACKIKLGSEHPWGSKHVIEKREQNNIEKYGVDNPFKDKEVQEKIKQENLEKYGETSYTKTPEYLERVAKTNLEKYGVPFHCMTEKCRKSQGKTISKINKEIGSLLDIDEHDYEFYINTYSYDLKKNNVLIEVDPTYTHNSTVAPHFRGHEGKPLPKDYHINKTKLANEHGYECIHIFDWDNLDKIKYMLQDKETLYARKLEIKEVSEIVCNEFLNENHLQNTCKNQAIRLGLYKDNELIQIMTFGKPRYNKNYEYELLRLCTNHKYKVTGGSERLFKYFIENYKPKSIISYCDNSKFSGEVYKRLEFDLKTYGSPTCHWYNLRTGRHITDNLLRQRGFSQLHKDNKYEKAKRGESNKELMIEDGYVEVYDCGQSVYIWNKG